jgi:hypothetical protein
VANRLDLNAARHIYTYAGGNMPQYLVNRFAEEIAAGETRGVLLCGGEALRTQHAIERNSPPGLWAESPRGEPELIGDPRRGWSDHEEKHNLRAAIAMYPLFENGIRGARGRDINTHMQAIGQLMAGFARVAAANPLATRREGHDAQRLVTVDEENRWIGFPYPRFLNSNAFIDQAAAVVMTSVKIARELGIPEGPLWGRIHRGESITLEDGRIIEASVLVGERRRGRRVVITGDTRPCAATIEAARDADLLIHEATFADEEAQRALETGPSTAREAAEVAHAAGARRLALTHISPRYSLNAKELEREARQVFRETVVVKDGTEIVLGLTEELATQVPSTDAD